MKKKIIVLALFIVAACKLFAQSLPVVSRGQDNVKVTDQNLYIINTLELPHDTVSTAATGSLASIEGIVYVKNVTRWERFALYTDVTNYLSSSQNQLLSGGKVVWLHDYVYNVSAASYLIDGQPYTSPSTDITLSAADATDDRIDLFLLTTSGTAVAVTGTPSTPPVAPDYDANTQLQISFATVTAATTEPVITTEWIYKENIEWTTFASAGTIVPGSTNNPYAGTKDVEGTAVANNQYISFTAPSAPNMGLYENLIFEIRSKANWTTTKKWIIRFYNGTTAIGNAVNFGSSSYGFVSSSTAQYQTITIPLTDFGNISSATAFRITQSNTSGTVGWYLDNVQLQGGQGGGSPQTTSLVADATGTGQGTIPVTVIGLRNKTLPALSAGKLYYTGSAWAFDNTTYQAQLNGTGFVKATGTTISYDNNSYTKISDTAAMMANAVRSVRRSSDSVYYNNSTGDHFAFKDSVGSGSGTNNANVGSGYRILKPATQELKTLFNGYGTLIDSSSNTNGLTTKIDTSVIGFNLGYYFATNYGAVDDGKILNDGFITASSSTFTSATASFTSADVGKTILVKYAGTSSGHLLTTIAGFTNSTTVTLTGAASTTANNAYFVYGTDNTQAIQTAVNAADAAHKGTVYLPRRNTGIYLLASALQASNSQLSIPVRASTNTNRTQITIQGEGAPNFKQAGRVVNPGLPSTGGTILYSVILSGAARAAVIGTSTGNYTYLTVKNLMIEVVHDVTGAGPVLGGISWKNGMSSLITDNVVVTIDTTATIATLPTTVTVGIETPDNGAETNNLITNIDAYGFYYAFSFSEHVFAVQADARVCYAAYELKPGDHASYAPRIQAYWCKYALKVTGACVWFIGDLELEAPTDSKWYDMIYAINDSLNLMKGNVFYYTTLGSVAVNGAANASLSYAAMTEGIASKARDNSFTASQTIGVAAANSTLTLNAANTTRGAQIIYNLNGSNTWNTGINYNLTGRRDWFLYDNVGAKQRMYLDSSGLMNLGGTTTANSTSYISGTTAGTNFYNGKFYVDATNSKVGINTTAPGTQFSAVGSSGKPTEPSYGAADVFSVVNNSNANFVWVTSAGGIAQAKVYSASTLQGTYAYDNTLNQWRFGANTTNAFTTSDILIGSNHKVGIGLGATDPSAFLHVLATTEQFRNAYNSTNYMSVTTASTGSTTFALTGTTPAFNFSQRANFNARIEMAKGASVASTGDLTLGSDGNVFHITGTTTINVITTSQWQAGSEVILIFDASVTVKNNTSSGGGTAVFLLAGGVDFSATANDVLTVVYDGTSWFEKCRSVN